jgi:hypothetical protein
VTNQLKNCAFRKRIEFPTEPPGGLPFSTATISRTVEQQYLQQMFQELNSNLAMILSTIFGTISNLELVFAHIFWLFLYV